MQSESTTDMVGHVEFKPKTAPKQDMSFSVKARNTQGREGYRRPTAQEYSAIRMAGVSKVEELIDMLREIDAKLDDASKQFERYQRRSHGTIAISFRQVDSFIYPFFVVFNFDLSSKSFRATTLTDEKISLWNLSQWSKQNVNPGLPFKKALHGLHKLIKVRRYVMARISGQPVHMNIASLESSVVATNRKVDRLLDDLVRRMVYDWEKQNGNKSEPGNN